MPVSAETAQRVALHTLGFDEFPPHLGGLSIINQAGDWLCSTRNWAFLDGADSLLDLTANQEFVTLPGDFQAVIELERNGGNISPSNWFSWTTVAEITRLRGTSDPAGGFTFSGAVGYRQTAGGSSPTTVLELYPTPTSTEVGAFRLRYRRQWRALTADHERAAIPGWMDALYLETVRAFAAGSLEEASATLSMRCAEVLGGPLFATAVRRDNALQTRYGKIQGGAAQGQRFVRNPNVTISN